MRQGAGMMQFLAATLDAAGVGQLAQHALELGAVGILHAEGARDLAGADLAALRADEGEDVVFAGEGRLGVGTFHEKWFREKSSLASNLGMKV
jgi:hypothetical protein